MSSTGLDAFERAQQRTNAWLAAVADEFGTDDRKFAFRALRAWLHVVRDRLTVPVAVKFAAQLPELLRGIYYDGWNPSGVPMKFGPEEFANRFAVEARIRTSEVPDAAGAVATALRRHMSQGEVDEVLAELPRELRDLAGGARASAHPRDDATADGADGTPVLVRLDRLERRLTALTDAMEVLARGLSDSRIAEHPDEQAREKSARLAADILLASRS